MVNAPEGTSANNPVIVLQTDLALSSGNTYAMSFTAEGESGKKILVKVAGQQYEFELNGEEQEYDNKLTVAGEQQTRILRLFLKHQVPIILIMCVSRRTA